jgi:hypothetical protein
MKTSGRFGGEVVRAPPPTLHRLGSLAEFHDFLFALATSPRRRCKIHTLYVLL